MGRRARTLTKILGFEGFKVVSTHFEDSEGAVVEAVGAESQYADVIRQVGGRYVHVTSILDNPNTDPHTAGLWCTCCIDRSRCSCTPCCAQALN